MHKDPDIVWDGDFPYDALADAGITLQSSIDEVRQAMHYYMEYEPSKKRAIRPAWDQLRLVERRLVVDFFLYRTEGPSGVEAVSHE